MVRVFDGVQEIAHVKQVDFSKVDAVSCIASAIFILPFMMLIFILSSFFSKEMLGPLIFFIGFCAALVIEILILLVVRTLVRNEDIIIKRSQVDGKVIVFERSIRFSKVNSRIFVVHIPDSNVKSFKILKSNRSVLQEAFEKLGAKVELKGSFPGFNPNGK